MPYIGNTAADRFVASKAASVFSGDGSTTAFTLDHSVGSDEDILVSVDGVIQEPSVAYSVSGTTLTFTAAPSSNAGNNIFVYYLFRTVGTVSHPSSNALEATSGTFTDTLTGTAGTFSGDLTVDTSTLKVDSTNNRVGINVSSPTVALDVASADDNQIQIANTGGGAAFIGIDSSNVLNIGRAGPVDIALQTNSAERMRIHDNGRVDVNTGSYTGSAQLTVTHVGSSVVGVRLSDETSTGTHNNIQFLRNGTQVGKIETTNQTSTAFVTSSDYRMKDNVNYSWDATTKLKQLKPAEFTWREEFDSDQTQVQGFIAHEVQSVVPEAVTGTHNEVDDDGNPVYQGIDQSKLVPLLVKTIQELEARITALENN